MAGFHVEPEYLERFARSCDKHGDELRDLMTQLGQAKVGRDAFGHIPSIGSRIYEAYDNHVHECEDGLMNARDSTHSTAAKAALCALQYIGAEDSSTVR